MIPAGPNRDYTTVTPSPPPVGDTLAPPFPTGITATNGSGSVSVSVYQTGDPYDGATAPSGIASYVLNVAGVGDQTPVAAPNLNKQAQHAIYNIGSVSPAPTMAVNGRQVTVTSAGNGIDSTTDQITFVDPVEYTGNFDHIIENTSFYGVGSQYAYMGIMGRETTLANLTATPTARYVTEYQWLATNGQGLQAAYRATVGAAKTNITSVSGNSSARWLKLSKRRVSTTDTFTLSYSTDGGAWQTLTQRVETDWSNTITVGGFISNLADSHVLTGVFESIVSLPGTQALVTIPYTTSGSETLSVKSIDVNGNISAYSPTVIATGSTGGGSPLMKYNGGIYIRYVPPGTIHGYGDLTNPAVVANILAFIDSVSTDGWMGVCIYADWRAIETSFGVYDTSQLTVIYNRCVSYGLRLWITSIEGNAQTYPGQEHGVPQYMCTEFNSAHGSSIYLTVNSRDVPTGVGYSAIPMLWLATFMNRAIAYAQVLAAWGDGKAKLEGVSLLGELSLNVGANPAYPTSGYTEANMLTQLGALWSAWRTAAPHTLLGCYTNDWISNVPQAHQHYLALMETYIIMPHDVNVINHSMDVFYAAVSGRDQHDVYNTAAVPDMTQRLPVGMSNDGNDFWSGNNGHDPEFGPPYQTNQQIFDFMVATTGIVTSKNYPGPSAVPYGWLWFADGIVGPFNASHHFWLANIGQGGDDTNQWSPAQRAFLIARQGSLNPFTLCASLVGRVITGG